MSFSEYIAKEIHYIEWVSRRLNIPLEEAAKLWVESGMAERYSRKYRTEMASVK